MFQTLRQGALIYVLDKGENPELKTAQVSNVTAPTPKYPTNFVTPQNMFETIVDVKIKMSDGTEQTFEKVPGNSSIANFGSIVISESKEAMSSEVEAMLNNSRQVLDSVGYHQRVIDPSSELLKQLNPQYAKEKATEERMDSLETSLSEIKNLLARMAGTSK